MNAADMVDTAQSKWITASEMINRIVDALPVRQDKRDFPWADAAENIEHAALVEDLTLYGYTVTDPVRPIPIPPGYWDLFCFRRALFLLLCFLLSHRWDSSLTPQQDSAF